MTTFAEFYGFGALVYLVISLLVVVLMPREKLLAIWQQERWPAISLSAILLKALFWPWSFWRIIARLMK